MKRVICLLIIILMMIPILNVYAENTNMVDHRAIVTAKLLNGRIRPDKSAMKTAFFDRGDELELTGRWSDDHDWVEVYAGEAGTCWVARQYISENTEPFIVVNQDYNKIRIRKKPTDKSKTTGYLKKGREIEITQVLLGWGKCKLGWIDLYYVEEK